MINLLIYISPTGSFDNERPDLINDASVLIKVQIDNGLALGWQKEDILLVTNFGYQYGGINAVVLEGAEFFERKPQASKINAISNLFERGMIRDGELYWFHDLDAHQLQPITEAELGLETADMALTDYGVSSRWSTGVIFFKKSAKDIFDSVKDIMYRKNIDEERALTILTRTNEEINKRVKKISKSYNFTPPKLAAMYHGVEKPLKVAHFHLVGGNGRFEVKNPVAFFKGENELHIPLITERLIKIFDDYGIK